MRNAVAFNNIDDSFNAGKSLIQEVLEQLKKSTPDILLLFTTVGHDIPMLLNGIRSIVGDVPICGCTGAGVISSFDTSEAVFSACLMGLKADQIRFDPFIVFGLSKDSSQVGKKMGNIIKSLQIPVEDNKLLFLFPDSMTTNAEKLLQGIITSLPYPLDILGAAAANDFNYSHTYQFCGNTVLEDSVAGLLISGNFRYHYQISHGQEPFGPLRTVTKAIDNRLLEIDDRPALDVLSSSIGLEKWEDFAQAVMTSAIGLSFPGNSYSEDLIIRGMINFDVKEKSVSFSVPIPEGSTFYMTLRNREKILQASQKMGSRLHSQLKTPEEAAFFYFNCAGRGSYLFGESEPDVHAVMGGLGCNQSMIGLFSFGEFGPVHEKNHFHNATGIIVGIEER
ncbi:FIST signal transduction protein [Alkalihalobacillus sp. BA299]|uniref:FIST signal transduction protein n=1 Tax=Alkalihalobacillus sp. BA299 TaxID=2815938 RepID=UPI001ADA1263|nr:FIST N-terminal domain-containing protein [Alkalihalobacillus sp. BA299]